MNVLKLRRTWMVAVGVLVTAGTLVVADMAWSQPDGRRRGWMGRRGPGGPGGPGGRGGVLRVPLGQLGLSEEQRCAVRGVLEEGREALREAGGVQARASRQALRDAVGTGATSTRTRSGPRRRGSGRRRARWPSPGRRPGRGSGRCRPPTSGPRPTCCGRPGSSGWKRGASASRSGANAGRSAATSAKGAAAGGRDAGGAGGTN